MSESLLSNNAKNMFQVIKAQAVERNERILNEHTLS